MASTSFRRKRKRLMEEGFFFESRPQLRKMDSDEEDSDFECYDRSEGRKTSAGRHRQ